MNKILKFAFGLLLYSHLNAANVEGNTQEQTTAKMEKGINFGNFDEKKKPKKTKKTIPDLLADLLAESKKQTKLQTEIRDILKNEFDPSPKTIIGDDGKPCVANSSAKCFQMPMINEVKGIPAIADALQNRDLASVKVKELWYGKYVGEVLKLSYLKAQAHRELGDKYPLAKNPVGSVNPAQGWGSVFKNNYRRQLFQNSLNKFEFNVFLGKNRGLDMYALYPTIKLLAKNKDLKMNLVFFSDKEYRHWLKQAKNISSFKKLKNITLMVQPDAFEEFKVHTTPSVYIRDPKKSKDTIIHIGRFVQRDLINKTLAYMVNEKYLKRSDLSNTKAWGSSNNDNKIEQYFKHGLGVEYVK